MHPSPTMPLSNQTPSTSTQSLSDERPLDTEKTAEAPISPDDDLTQFGPAPDGGTEAWLNALGGFCIFFGCLGFTSCFGVLQEYYSTHQLRHLSPSQVSWIGSLSSFIQFGGGMAGGPVFDRYGIWVSGTPISILTCKESGY